jgi:hypothetical protein
MAATNTGDRFDLITWPANAAQSDIDPAALIAEHRSGIVVIRQVTSVISPNVPADPIINRVIS